MFFFDNPLWQEYGTELGIGTAIEYLERNGHPSGWVTKIVDTESNGSVFLPAGKPHYKCPCPFYEGYWLHGGIGSVQCKAMTELLPGIVWYKVCSQCYEECPFYKMNSSERNGGSHD